MVKQKIITCAGYYGTGSSAITDLLGEFADVYYMGDYEFRFIQDPGGICDLDYNLNENYHRHNSGHALKRFKKNVDFLSGNKLIKKYEMFFGGKFKELSYKYIDDLTLCTFKGYWHQDVIDRGYWFYLIERSLDKILNKVFVRLIRGKNNIEPISIHLLKNEITYVPDYNPERFIQLTREYLNNLFSSVNKNNKKYVMVDQLVPPTNASRYVRYFDDIKVFIVDRDPRDLYILEKIIWKGGCVPVDDVKTFCYWYRINREHRKRENLSTDKIKLVQFEDLVYHYDETVSDVLSFLSLEKASQLTPQLHFNPAVSIKNTQLWKSHPELETEIRFIEKNLSEFIYTRY